MFTQREKTLETTIDGIDLGIAVSV
jgi:hypothetical protein